MISNFLRELDSSLARAIQRTPIKLSAGKAGKAGQAEGRGDVIKYEFD